MFSPTISPVQVARVLEIVRYRVGQIHQRMVPPPAAMMEMITNAWVAQAITAAADLGIADALAKQPMTVDELADRDGAPHRFAYPTARDYEQGFYLWRAIKRDGRLAADEERAREPVVLARLGLAASSYEEAIDNAVASVRGRHGLV